MAEDVGLPRTIMNTDYTDFGPRFGFAWRVFGSSRSGTQVAGVHMVGLDHIEQLVRALAA